MEIRNAIESLDYIKYCNCYKGCRESMAIEMAKNVLEKQVPMKHHHTVVCECSGGERVRTSICPSCLGCIMTVEEEFPRFCLWCGQAIDWSK